jgi:hypothetical protein
MTREEVAPILGWKSKNSFKTVRDCENDGRLPYHVFNPSGLPRQVRDFINFVLYERLKGVPLRAGRFLIKTEDGEFRHMTPMEIMESDEYKEYRLSLEDYNQQPAPDNATENEEPEVQPEAMDKPELAPPVETPAEPTFGGLVSALGRYTIEHSMPWINKWILHPDRGLRTPLAILLFVCWIYVILTVDITLNNVLFYGFPIIITCIIYAVIQYRKRQSIR